jgi:hypothetical protein
MPLFDDLKVTYPHQSKEDLFAGMGGEWPSLIGNPNYRNTCAIRLSIALNAAGYAIPGKFREGITGSGENIVIKLKTMWDCMTERFGTFSWGMSKNPGSPVQIPPRQGVICYHAAFSDATGHFDLWTGTDFVGVGNLSDVQYGFDLAMWF